MKNFLNISVSPLCDQHIFLVSVMDLTEKSFLSVSVVADLQYELLNLKCIPVLPSEVEEIFFYSFLEEVGFTTLSQEP